MTEGEHEVQEYTKGERVFCYEPDTTKAKVLYTSKVLAVTERKDENGLRYYEYMIHFQGWRRSYDRNVRASCLLKDTEENRQYQRELAEAARLQTRGSYSYKGTPSQQPHAKKKRLRRGGGQGDEAVGTGTDPLDLSQEEYAEPEAPAAHRFKVPSGDISGGAVGSNLDKSDATMRNKRARLDPPTSRPPKAKPADVVADIDVMERIKYQEDRVMLLISERLREYMEYDYNMVVKLNKQHAMPARIPIVTILENFVKQRAVELAISIKQDSSRARNTQSRSARMEREYDRVMSKVCLLKEVVDGIRIYFEFHVDQHLLYKQEKKYTNNYLTDDNLKNCSIVLNNSYDYINPSCEPDLMSIEVVSRGGDCGPGGLHEGILGDFDYKRQLEKCLDYIDKTVETKKSVQTYGASIYDAANKLPIEMRGFLCETFNWRLLSAESPPEKSMVFGAPHLARLMIKLPECLNASPISNEKLDDLLPHLDSFINYLENHKEWFDRQNYAHYVPQEEKLQQDLLDSLKRPTATATATKISSQV